MNAIHDSVAGAVEQSCTGEISADSYQQLTTQANKQLAYIFENCKLPTDAVVSTAQMLNSYDGFFDHQDWKANDRSH